MNQQPSQINRDINRPQITLSIFKKFIELCNNENYHMIMHMLELIPLIGCSELEYCFMMENYESLTEYFSNLK